MVCLTDSESPLQKPLVMPMRGYLDYVNWSKKTYFKCGQYPSICWHPATNQKEKAGAHEYPSPSSSELTSCLKLLTILGWTLEHRANINLFLICFCPMFCLHKQTCYQEGAKNAFLNFYSSLISVVVIKNPDLKQHWEGNNLYG